ncbi:methyl-accepting chemotaxis protein [Chromobacterium vaccinii]|uniref:methyl-accepting chemotaxis protein n=1 Tax=Chromobacterium vaccinii TaxID=1108595 RepID=UPI003C7792DD
MSAYWLVVFGVAGLAVFFAVVAVVCAFRARSRLAGEDARREAGRPVAADVALSTPATMSEDEAGLIVGMTRSLAAQANLLALNAAIEAARAGEQGGGLSEGLVAISEEARRLSEHVAQVSTEAAAAIGKAQRSAKADSPEALHPHGPV